MASANQNRPPTARTDRLGGAALLLLALTACGAESGAKQAPPTKVWVGELADSDVAVGIAASGSHSTLFFCGGDRSFTDHTRWFIDAGPLVDGVQIDDGVWHVSIRSVSAQIAGTLVIDGLDSAPFSAEAVTPGTLAGVYDALAPCGHAGLIVRQPTDTSPALAQGTCLQSRAGLTVAVEQVNPVLPVTRSVDFGIVGSLADDPSQQFTLRPLSFAQ